MFHEISYPTTVKHISSHFWTIIAFCTIVLRQGVNIRDLDAVLFESGVSQSVEDQLLECLVNAGVHITGFPR